MSVLRLSRLVRRIPAIFQILPHLEALKTDLAGIFHLPLLVQYSSWLGVEVESGFSWLLELLRGAACWNGLLFPDCLEVDRRYLFQGPFLRDWDHGLRLSDLCNFK